jgi:DNA-binding LacI/PurR family transcriptional regulator
MQQIRSRKKQSFHGNLAYLHWCARRENSRGLPVARRFHSGALRSAEAHGYALTHLCPIADGLNRTTLMRMLQARGIGGAVVLIHVAQDPFTHNVLAPRTNTASLPLDFARLATAALGGKFSEPSPHFATNDQYAAGRLVGERLLARGYQRPGVALSNYLDTVTENRFHAGLHAVWSRHRRATSLRSLVYRQDDTGAFLAWVREEKPDVVISYTNAALPWLKAAGFAVPHNLGFVSLDVTPADGIAGIDQRHEEVGAAAVDLVIEQLNRDEHGLPGVPRGVLIEGVWIDGPTLRRPAK